VALPIEVALKIIYMLLPGDFRKRKMDCFFVFATTTRRAALEKGLSLPLWGVEL